MPNVKHASLRESLLASIGEFLYDENFTTDQITKAGILEIINLISDYHEEGSALFPEVLVTNDLEFFKTIPHQEIPLQRTALAVTEFKNAIKLCAPLAKNGWIIFIEVKDKTINFGVISAEVSETSPSIYNQTVGDLKLSKFGNVRIAYIKNIGQKVVELSGFNRTLVVSLNLEEPSEKSRKEVQLLCEKIVLNCVEEYKINLSTFFNKNIDGALKIGHGNLIGVIFDDDKTMENLKSQIAGNGGIYLPEPIDFQKLIIDFEKNKDIESSTILRNYSEILKSMLNHDGITILTTTGKVIAYHILIDSFIKEGDQLDGGARTKAYRSMQNCGHFACVLYKSQDGNTKYWVQ